MAVIGLTVVAFFLFSLGRVAIPTTSLLVLVALTVGFYPFPFERAGVQLRPTEFYLGFGHEALVTIASLMVLGRGLVVTGALEPAARWFARIWSAVPQLAMLLLLVFCAAASGVINDTPVVVMMMPILVSVALRTRRSPARSLLPMNYAVILGGTTTTIGTSTNLLVVAIAADLGMRRLGVFEFTPLAVLAAAVGLIYVWVVLPRLLPEREPPMGDAAPRVFKAVLYVAENSVADGATVREAIEATGGRMRIQRIARAGEHALVALPEARLRAGDRIYLADTPDNLKEFEQVLGATLYPANDTDRPVGEENPLTAPDQQLAEVVVTEPSVLNDNTVRRTRFEDFYNVVILALHRPGRRGRARPVEIADTVLRVGEVLLVQGAKEDIHALRTSGLLVLDQTIDLPHTSRAPVALAILAGVIALATAKVLPISISAPAGVLAMLVTGCLRWHDVGAALSAKVVLLLVSSLALGAALTRTGGTD